MALLKNQQNRQTRLIKKNRSLKSVKSQMKGDTTNFTEIKQTIKEYYEQLYANKLDSLLGQIPRKSQAIDTKSRRNKI